MCLMSPSLSLSLFDIHILPISFSMMRAICIDYDCFAFKSFFFLLSLLYDLIIIFLFHSLIATVKKGDRGGRQLFSNMCNIQTTKIV
jgi:hypothetical protein